MLRVTLRFGVFFIFSCHTLSSLAAFDCTDYPQNCIYINNDTNVAMSARYQSVAANSSATLGPYLIKDKRLVQIAEDAQPEPGYKTTCEEDVPPNTVITLTITNGGKDLICQTQSLPQVV